LAAGRAAGGVKAEKGGDIMPPQRVYSKTTGIHNSLETISSTRKIRPKIAPNHANGGRVTRGGFDM
ncbi:hypothetical protein DLM15_16095, partial [Salmonella enterica subsp. enterica serovar Typhimurium]|nr:hypothetical protein [Salmonella enterica subsp. enterica serovar Typhimurium]